MRRKGTINHQFAQRIPADVRSQTAGLRLEVPLGGGTYVPVTLSPNAQAVRLSLRASTPHEVKARQGQVAAYLERTWRNLRENRPLPLNHRQAVALAGELYASWVSERRQDIGVSYEEGRWIPLPASDLMDNEPDAWEAAIRRALSDGEGGQAPESELPRVPAVDLEKACGPLVDRLLRRKGFHALDPESREMVLDAFMRALRDAMASRQKHARGDYSPDPIAGRFPAFEVEPPATKAVPAPSAAASVSLKGLVDGWWKEAEASGRAWATYESYKGTFNRLAAYLKHDNAAAVTADDIVAFKNARLAEGVSAKTVGDGDIPCLRVVFEWAVANRKLPANPAKGIRVVRPRVIQVRPKEFTLEEANAILAHCANYQPGREKPKTAAAKRWVPWLCAYTGARVGEIVQLRREDIKEHAGGACTITITPEAGTVKDKKAREVVLHAHLVEAGFLDFAKESSGYLFITPAPDGDIVGVWRSIKNRVTEFVREVLTDPNVSPNHGWRHLFKTIGREAGIADSVLDAICGHAAKTVGGAYGGVTLKAQADAIAKFPRFELGDGSAAAGGGHE